MSWINSEYQKQDRSPPALRRFGFTLGFVAILLGAVFIWRHRAAGWPFISIGGIFLLTVAFAPSTLKWVHKPWTTLSLILGWIVSRILLTVIFFLVLTPIGLLQRICGKRVIETTFRTKASSYWQPRRGRFAPADYENQF
ncbi:MAG: SxtJ family membrane protein [Chthoniobacterales bacterium]